MPNILTVWFHINPRLSLRSQSINKSYINGTISCSVFIWSSCQLCLYSHQHIYQQLQAFSNTRLAPQKTNNYLKPKIISVFAAVSTGWCEPVEHSLVGHCGDSTAAKGTGHVRYFLSPVCVCQHWVWLWWTTFNCHLTSARRQDRSWETQGAFGRGYPCHLCQGQCPEVTKASGKSVPDSRDSLLGTASGIANKDAMCEGGSNILLHTQAQQEPRWGWDWLIIPCRQTTPDLAFPQSEFHSYRALMPEGLSIPFQKLQTCTLLSSPPLLFLLLCDPWLQLISMWRQAQLLQIAIMFKLAPWWILEAAYKKC